jgi:hypothetical protein
MRPGKGGKDRSGRTDVVSEIEVVGAGIIEIDGSFYKTQAENFGVEVQIALWIRGNCGYVMESCDGS